MSEMEKSKLIQYLIEQREEQREETRRREEAASKEREALQRRITELTEQNTRQMTEMLKLNSDRVAALMKQICYLTTLIKEKDDKIADLESRLKLGQRIRYSRTSQKKSSKKNDGDNKPAAPCQCGDT